MLIVQDSGVSRIDAQFGQMPSERLAQSIVGAGTLVVIDETGASTKMVRLHVRAPRGERLRTAIPHGH